MGNMLVIIGATASGKSALAMEVGRRTAGAEILSVDSMQVYRGMDIGTAKPSRAEQAEVRHHLIDVAEPTESFAVARFVEMADRVIADGQKRGAKLIATGGTPLYYKALFEGLFEGPGADEAVRAKLKSFGNEELWAKLKAVDPEAAGRIHVNDTKRLVRALEVYEITGRTITSMQNEWGAGMRRHEAVWVGLNWEREALNRRINARVKAMVEGGWVEEVRRLPWPLSGTAGEATGYREMREVVEGKKRLDDAVEEIKMGTRQLARRQMKWFRRFPRVTWIDGTVPLEEQVNAVMAKWRV